jgi:hypothetical protein
MDFETHLPNQWHMYEFFYFQLQYSLVEVGREP